MTVSPAPSHSRERRLFLSYGREDDKAFVARVHKFLRQLKFFVWYDQDNLLSRGADFTDEIARAIEGSDVLLLFVGPHATQSEWVKREWLHALKYCIPVIPLIVKGDGKIDETLTAYPHAVQSANAIDCRKHHEGETWNAIIDKLAQFLNADPLPLAALHGVSALPQYYIERPQYLDALKGKLAIGDPTQPDRTRIAAITSRQEVAALQGIGGIGKTTLALAVCADCDVRRTFERIVFVSVGPDKGAETAHILLHDVGAAFEPGLPLYQSLNEARVDLGGRLRGTRTLIVLDDVWQEGITDAFSFGGVDCRLLVTTRNKTLVDDETQVDKLDVSESLALISAVLGTEPDALPPACTRIVTTLDGHTLAVRIAAAWLKKFGLSRAEKYADDLTSADAFAHLQLGKDKNINLEKSLTLSFEALEADDRARFRALGVLAPSSFDLTLLAALWGVEDALYPAQTLVDAALMILTTSKPEEDEPQTDILPTERYSLHPLLHTYARALISRPDEAEARESAFERYAEYIITLAEGFIDLPTHEWWQLDADLPHVDFVGDELTQRCQVAPEDVMLQEWIGRFVWNVKNYVYYRPQIITISKGTALRGLNWLDMGLEVARKTGDQEPESLFLNQIALAWDLLGEKPKALDYYEQALLIDHALGNRGGEATTLNNIGMVWSALGEKRKALDYLEQALALYRAEGDRGGEAVALNNIGAVWDNLGEKRKALDYYEQALPLRRAVGDWGGEAVTLNNIGMIWDDLGEKRKALDYLEQALPLHRAVGDRDSEATTLNNLGLVWFALREPQKALDYYEQALPIHREVGNRTMEATTLNNLGLVWFELRESQKALDYYEQALPLRRVVSDRGGEARTLNNMAFIYAQEGDFARAVAVMEQIIPIVREMGVVTEEAAYRVNLAVYLQTLNCIDEAITHLETAIQLLTSRGLDRAASGATVGQMREILAELRGGRRRTLKRSARI